MSASAAPTLLLAELIARREAHGARQMFALVNDSATTASIGLGQALGFAEVGVMRAAGWKLGRWLDVVVLRRHLGTGERTSPA